MVMRMSEKYGAIRYVDKQLIMDERDAVMKDVVHSLANELIDILWTELEKGEKIVNLSEMWTETFPQDNMVRCTQWVKMDELVRCKDCKHRHIDGTCPFGLAGGPEFFCAYGARGDADG